MPRNHPRFALWSADKHQAVNLCLGNDDNAGRLILHALSYRAEGHQDLSIYDHVNKEHHWVFRHNQLQEWVRKLIQVLKTNRR